MYYINININNILIYINVTYIYIYEFLHCYLCLNLMKSTYLLKIPFWFIFRAIKVTYRRDL